MLSTGAAEVPYARGSDAVVLGVCGATAVGIQLTTSASDRKPLNELAAEANRRISEPLLARARRNRLQRTAGGAAGHYHQLIGGGQPDQAAASIAALALPYRQMAEALIR